MFLGHLALGLAAKRATPRVQLAVLLGASQTADLLWPVFLALGIERVRIDPGNTAFTPLDFVSYPYSHSLLMLVVWGAVLALIYRIVTHRNGRTFAVIALLVVSHWVLDFVTHRPDMPLYPGGPTLGLGLWNSVRATIGVEVAMFFGGLWVYTRMTRPRDGVGRWAFVGLVLFMWLAYVANIVSGPPPSVTALSSIAIAGALLLLAWTWWADAHREVVT